MTALTCCVARQNRRNLTSAGFRIGGLGKLGFLERLHPRARTGRFRIKGVGPSIRPLPRRNFIEGDPEYVADIARARAQNMPGGAVVLTGRQAWQVTGVGGSSLNPQPITPASQQAQPLSYHHRWRAFLSRASLPSQCQQ